MQRPASLRGGPARARPGAPAGHRRRYIAFGTNRDYQVAFDEHIAFFDELIAGGAIHKATGKLLAEIGIAHPDGTAPPARPPAIKASPTPPTRPWRRDASASCEQRGIQTVMATIESRGVAPTRASWPSGLFIATEDFWRASRTSGH